MNIKDFIKNLQAVRGDKSYAFLAERVPTTPDSPYRIGVAQPLLPHEPKVLILGGAGGPGDNLRGYNSYLKQTDEFIRQVPELKEKNVRVCVAVCNFGRYHDDETARYAKHLQYIASPQRYNEYISNVPAEAKSEIIHPAYIQDIFDAAILPCIAANDGKIRLPLVQALRNTRNLNIVTHCHGAYVAFCLEEMMYSKMEELGYSAAEKQQIQRELMVLNYNPDCPNKTKSRFFSVSSAADDRNCLQSVFKEWLQMTGKRFQLIFDENELMCSQIDKAGIEGNPPRVYVARKIEDLWEETRQKNTIKDYQEPEEVKTIGEHDFLGFKPCRNMSRRALKMQALANNILSSAVIHSANQPQEGFSPLPSFFNLAGKTTKQKLDLIKANLTLAKLDHQFIFHNRKKLNNFIAWHQSCRVRLD